MRLVLIAGLALLLTPLFAAACTPEEARDWGRLLGDGYKTALAFAVVTLVLSLVFEVVRAPYAIFERQRSEIEQLKGQLLPETPAVMKHEGEIVHRWDPQSLEVMKNLWAPTTPTISAGITASSTAVEALPEGIKTGPVVSEAAPTDRFAGSGEWRVEPWYFDRVGRTESAKQEER